MVTRSLPPPLSGPLSGSAWRSDGRDASAVSVAHAAASDRVCEEDPWTHDDEDDVITPPSSQTEDDGALFEEGPVGQDDDARELQADHLAASRDDAGLDEAPFDNDADDDADVLREWIANAADDDANDSSVDEDSNDELDEALAGFSRDGAFALESGPFDPEGAVLGLDKIVDDLSLPEEDTGETFDPFGDDEDVLDDAHLPGLGTGRASGRARRATDAAPEMLFADRLRAERKEPSP